jgi:uncharacterized membrane protein
MLCPGAQQTNEMIENSTDARAALAQRRHGEKIARAIARLAGTNGVFLTYCTNAVLAKKDVPALENVKTHWS